MHTFLASRLQQAACNSKRKDGTSWNASLVCFITLEGTCSRNPYHDRGDCPVNLARSSNIDMLFPPLRPASHDMDMRRESSRHFNFGWHVCFLSPPQY